MPGNANGRRGRKFLRGEGGNVEARGLEDFLELLWEILQAEP